MSQILLVLLIIPVYWIFPELSPSQTDAIVPFWTKLIIGLCKYFGEKYKKKGFYKFDFKAEPFSPYSLSSQCLAVWLSPNQSLESQTYSVPQIIAAWFFNNQLNFILVLLSLWIQRWLLFSWVWKPLFYLICLDLMLQVYPTFGVTISALMLLVHRCQQDWCYCRVSWDFRSIGLVLLVSAANIPSTTSCSQVIPWSPDNAQICPTFALDIVFFKNAYITLYTAYCPRKRLNMPHLCSGVCTSQIQ